MSAARPVATAVATLPSCDHDPQPENNGVRPGESGLEVIGSGGDRR